MNLQILQIALWTAMRDRDIAAAKKSLEKGAQPDFIANGMLSPLHAAAAFDFVPGLELLHGLGVGIDTADPSSPYKTPLMQAAKAGHIRAGQWLLDHGANAGVTTPDNHSALCTALLNQNLDFADLLLRERPDLRENELNCAAEIVIPSTSSPNLVHWLLKNGVSPDFVNRHKEPWLMIVQDAPQIAADSNVDAVMDLLLSAGADANKPSRDGNTALHMAFGLESTGIFMKLLQAGADPDQPTCAGTTVRQLLASQVGTDELRSAFLAWESSSKAHQAIHDAPAASPRPL